MLNTLALLLAVQNPSGNIHFELKSPAEAFGLAKAAGYEVTGIDAGGRRGQVARGGSVAEALVSGDGTHLSFQAEIAAPKEVDEAQFQAWRRNAIRSRRIFANAALGPTVDVSTTVRFTGAVTPDAVRRSLDEFFDAADAVAQHVGGGAPRLPRKGWRDAAFPDSTVLRVAAPVSLMRAFESWGWTGPRVRGVSAISWLEPIVVDGRRVWARLAVVNGMPSVDAFEVVALDPKDPGTPSTYALTHPEVRPGGYSQAEFDAHPDDILIGTDWHRPAARMKIDVAPGVTLGAIRSRVEAFARASGTAEIPRGEVGE